MISLAWPWLLLALPLPWLARRWLPPAPPVREPALRVPALDDFAFARAVPRARRWPLWVAALAWALLVLAAARPQWLGEAVELPVSGRSLMLAVDLSGSMGITDFSLDGEMVDRLSAVKVVASEFVRRRVGDRIGLILFGEQAYLQAPLTFDRVTVQTLLAESAIGLAGRQTAIGDAIGLAVKRLREGKDQSQVLILMTDGANNAGTLSPLIAASLAADIGLKVYTVGVGADTLLVPGFFGMRRINPSADLDEDMLQTIALKTGGRYFRARDTQSLEDIYRLLDLLEPVEQNRQSYRPVADLYYWPLGLALGLAGALAWLRARGRLAP